MNELWIWKGLAALGAIIGTAFAAIAVTPWAAIILSVGVAAGLILLGVERTFRGYAEVVRAQNGKD